MKLSKKKSRAIIIKYCPRCKTTNLDLYAGSLTGVYYCKKCGYFGTLVIEKSFIRSKLS